MARGPKSAPAPIMLACIAGMTFLSSSPFISKSRRSHRRRRTAGVEVGRSTIQLTDTVTLSLSLSLSLLSSGRAMSKHDEAICISTCSLARSPTAIDRTAVVLISQVSCDLLWCEIEEILNMECSHSLHNPRSPDAPPPMRRKRET